MGFTEKLANLDWYYVLLVVAGLLVIRFALIKRKMEFAKTVAELAESLAVAMVLVYFIIRPFLVQAFFIPSGSMHPTLLENDHLIVNKLIYRFWEPKVGDVVVFKAPAEWDHDNQEKEYIKRLIGLPGDKIKVKGGVIMIGGLSYGREQTDYPKISQALIEKDLIDPDIAGKDGEILVKIVGDSLLVQGKKKITRQEIAKSFGVPLEDVVIKPGITYRNGKPMNIPQIGEDPDYDLPEVTIKPGHVFVCGDNRNNSNDSHVHGQLDRKRLLGKAMFIFWPVTRWGMVAGH